MDHNPYVGGARVLTRMERFHGDYGTTDDTHTHNWKDNDRHNAVECVLERRQGQGLPYSSSAVPSMVEGMLWPHVFSSKNRCAKKQLCFHS